MAGNERELAVHFPVRNHFSCSNSKPNHLTMTALIYVSFFWRESVLGPFAMGNQWECKETMEFIFGEHFKRFLVKILRAEYAL